MINPQDAERELDKHFEQVSLEEFKEHYENYVGPRDLLPQVALPSPGGREVILSQKEAAPLKLSAYLASALTGLDAEQRNNLFEVADLVTTACEELDIAVYEPRKSTDPVLHPEVTPEDVYHRDREIVLAADLVIHIADYASTGSGEELDFAQAALIPIVLLSHGDSVVSRMVLGIPGVKLVVTYNTLEELRTELRQCLTGNQADPRREKALVFRFRHQHSGKQSPFVAPRSPSY